MKTIETIGTIAGIIGAFLIAFKLGKMAYPILLVSATCLLVSAIAYRQRNFIALQSVFLAANLVGFVNYVIQ